MAESGFDFSDDEAELDPTPASSLGPSQPVPTPSSGPLASQSRLARRQQKARRTRGALSDQAKATRATTPASSTGVVTQLERAPAAPACGGIKDFFK